MRAIDILPFCFFMGVTTFVFYFVTGLEIFMGQNIAFLTIVFYVVVNELLETRRAHRK